MRAFVQGGRTIRHVIEELLHSTDLLADALLVHELVLVGIEGRLSARVHALAGVILGEAVRATELRLTEAAIARDENGALGALAEAALGLLAASTKTEDEVESRFLLDVVVGEGTAVLELLAGEDEALLVGRDALLVLDLLLHILDRVRALDLEGDRLTRKRLDEDLHAAAQTKNEVESRLLLDVVVGEGAAVLELLASKDETLLVGR